MFLKVVLVLAIISFLLACYSLKKESHKREILSVKKKLSKGRVVFQRKS